jgi:citrate lyase subunit beta/citryl-CoA lyase
MTFGKRAPHHRRSWLFLPGADREQLVAAPALGADVLIQELEDSVPPQRRAEARTLSPEILRGWNAAGVLSAIRINPLDAGGTDDLAAAMPGRPAVVLMSKVSSAEQVRRLDQAILAREQELGIPSGTTEIVPNIETAAGLVRTGEIVGASPRVTAALVAAEDMAADLGAERTFACTELAYPRSRFLVECVAAGVVAIDCPYTFTDLERAEIDTRYARGLGYKAKSIVNPEEVRHATRIVAAFEAARAQGLDRAEVDALMVEVPTYLAAKRLLARAAELGQA